MGNEYYIRRDPDMGHLTALSAPRTLRLGTASEHGYVDGPLIEFYDTDTPLQMTVMVGAVKDGTITEHFRGTLAELVEALKNV